MLEKSGEKWLVEGLDDPTIADCYAVSFLRSFTKGHIDYVDTDCLSESPKIVDYIKRFCALPQINGWYKDGLGGKSD